MGARDELRLGVSVQGVQVDVRHDQGHVLVHAECTARVDDGAACCQGLGCKLAGNIRPGTKEHQPAASEIEPGQIERWQRAILESRATTHRAVAGERPDIAYREVSLREHVQQRFAHQPCGSDHRDIDLVVSHLVITGIFDTTSAFWPRCRR